jgi:hypothetical protein
MQHCNAGEVAQRTRRAAKVELEKRDQGITEDITEILQDIFILFGWRRVRKKRSNVHIFLLKHDTKIRLYI